MQTLKTCTISLAVVFFLLTGKPGSVRGQESKQVSISMTDFHFMPNTLFLSMGQPVTLSLVNKGSEKHEFESDLLGQQEIEIQVGDATIEGSGIEEIVLQPGATATLSFVPVYKGMYRFKCDIKNYERMVGTIHVE